MEIKELIILAGGLGTRLRQTVPDLPKSMALINGRPFIEYVIRYFKIQGIEKFIFALGYKHGEFEDFLQTVLSPREYILSVEDEPLGTGGAVRLALSNATADNVFVTNGDTLFTADLPSFASFHLERKASCSLSLKPMKDISRFGTVTIDQNSCITQFKEKQFYTSGLINAGLYALNVQEFTNRSFPDKFSFEKDYLEKYYAERKFFGLPSDSYFIDIGIPEDYFRAQQEFQNLQLLKWLI